MPRHLLVVVALALFFVALVASGSSGSDGSAYDEAARTILCDCGCHPQSVHDCACSRAAQMRNEILGHAESGLTGAQIIALYVERYGPQIRVSPTATGFNLVAWIGPFLGLLACSFGLVFVLRRWSRRAASRDTGTPPSPPAASDDPYGERLERALEHFE